MIKFNVPVRASSYDFLEEIEASCKYSGDGPLTQKCHEWFDNHFKGAKTLFTTSCTHALEMMALLIDVKPGDEIILPSYTFVTSGSPFVARGAKLIFVDINPVTMNIDENKIEEAVTEKTKAILIVHYAGFSCDIDKVKEITSKHGVFLLEDAAQALMSKYKGQSLGTFGDLSAFSFHETKNFHCGEGGLLVVNNLNLFKKAEMIREKGTDRASFLRGEVDKYTWQCLGSSYLPSEFNAGFLLDQLRRIEELNSRRVDLWYKYKSLFNELGSYDGLTFCEDLEYCSHNAHIFYIKLKNGLERKSLRSYLLKKGIESASHYVPLHTSPAGILYGDFFGSDKYTTKESERVLRLPMHTSLSDKDLVRVRDSVRDYFMEL
ncbi:dTDP-4-amino-4,6-dideoxygalactose transaminase [Halobacteriovorax sp. JY17]|uniref:dTDP-4-amino-4,6-dideoxygalactose transaminase n=1 Tax=Halobacteriovorax sp. JY17 TaxID=2014617 RepID=UPI000C5C2CAB|nr:dTDP-4-amino-4,6-dideoxygalactose transaminase [Halobacteriovorax sp. JY17]PIK14678.1 MAG: dTDP-4-amino-4,6-dideoxygalactose transaminase [Halobacteriovorax sp. JY17]